MPPLPLSWPSGPPVGRRSLLLGAGAAVAGARDGRAQMPAAKPDYTIRIAPLSLEIGRSSFLIAPGQSQVYRYAPRPAGRRWCLSHAIAEADLNKNTYAGEFEFLIIEPPQPTPGATTARCSSPPITGRASGSACRTSATAPCPTTALRRRTPPQRSATLFHCDHQDHMDEGFAGLITYA